VAIILAPQGFQVYLLFQFSICYSGFNFNFSTYFNVEKLKNEFDS